MNEIRIKRKDIFEKMRSLPSIEEKRDAARAFFESPANDEAFAAFWKQFTVKFNQASRKPEYFEVRFKSWLDESVTVTGSSSVKKGGRPEIPFAECSIRTKRRKPEKIREIHSPQELAFAAEMSMRSSGKKDVADSIKRAVESRDESESISPEKAIAIIVQARLSKQSYKLIREPMKHCYPAYHKVLKAKKKCYPQEDMFVVDEVGVRIKLQALLDKTTERLLLSINGSIGQYSDAMLQNLQFIIKWGCDGASGLTEYKQRFQNSSNKDSHVFFTSLVPLRLSGGETDADILWDNEHPGSPYSCRPVNLQFCPETQQVIVDEYERMKSEIENLKPYDSIINGQRIVVSYRLYVTMVDGKLINVLTDTTSSQRCYACKATSSQFNNLEKMLNLQIDDASLDFGMSSLHAWIRAFECYVHIGYRLDFKKWRKSGNEELFDAAKRNIQDGFRIRMGLLIEKPKPGGAGNSNDGNTARRFFADPKVTSEICGVDVKLIERTRNILIAVSCGHEIDSDKFKVYCFETAELYVSLYPWYYMPTSLHKLLIHGHQIVEKSVLPVGRMSEEAQERSNKTIKSCRINFSRKNSRENTNRDIINRMLITSDPLINRHLKPSVKHHQDLPEDVILLLKRKNSAEPDDEEADNASSCDTESESED